MNLEEALGLSPEEAGRLLPLVKKLQTDRRRLVERRHETIGEMRGLLQSGTATEAQIAERMKEIRNIEAEEPLVLVKDRKAIDDVLSVVQQAKFRVLEVEVEQKLRDLARRPRPDRDRP
jgi:hypothetical protein